MTTPTNALGAAIGTVYNSGTGTFTGVPTGATGTILTSTGSGTAPSWQPPAALALPWNNVTGTSATMVINQGYSANNAGLVTLTMPTTVPFGSIQQLAAFGGGGFKVQLAAGQQLFTAGASSTVAGSLSSTAQYQFAATVCLVANLSFVISNMTGGSFTLA